MTGPGGGEREEGGDELSFAIVTGCIASGP